MLWPISQVRSYRSVFSVVIQQMLQQHSNHLHTEAVSQHGIPLLQTGLLWKAELGREAVQVCNFARSEVAQAQTQHCVFKSLAFHLSTAHAQAQLKFHQQEAQNSHADQESKEAGLSEVSDDRLPT